MERLTSHSVKIPFDEFADFIKVRPEQIKGGYVATYSKYIEVYLND